jgi:hypothetical protein
MANSQGLSKEDIDFDAIWGILATALTEIHTKNASKLSFEELYRAAYKIVLKKKAGLLYERVITLEEEWLSREVKERVETFVTPSLLAGAPTQSADGQANERRISGERFMKVLKDAFEDHQLCMSMIMDVLMYMVSLLLTRLHITNAILMLDQGPSILSGPTSTLHLYRSAHIVPKACSRRTTDTARPWKQHHDRSRNLNTGYDSNGEKWRGDRSKPHSSLLSYAGRVVRLCYRG